MDGLVIIDVQQGMFTTEGFVPHEGKAVVARIAELLEQARKNEVPVFFVQHDGGEGHPFARGSAGFPICSELEPLKSESVTVKRHCNSFQNTDLAQTLDRANIDHLIICGMQTEFCVDTAVRAAFERGYKVTLVSDGHTTFDTEVIPANKIIAHHNAILGGSFASLKAADEITFASGS